MNPAPHSVLDQARVSDQNSGAAVAVATPTGRFASNGALAGATSVVIFTAVHHLAISNIWSMLGPMMVAGALCGWSVAWTYGRLFDRHATGSWLGYNAVFLAMLALLAVISVLLFEPVTTMEARSARGGPVDDLIVKALPLTVAFTVLTSGLLGVMFARGWGDFLRLLLTVSVLALCLGLNVSALGLVGFSGGSILPVVVFFGLIVLLNVVFVAGVIGLHRGRALRSPG